MGQETEKAIQNMLVFFVNGNKVVEPVPDPEMTLLTYLRTQLHLTGSKLGCGEGGCGACTVMVSRYHAERDEIKHYSVNACLAPVCSMHGLAVTTVEGIGNLSNIHPVQERIAKFHGSQCGFCTPGIVMSMYTLLRNNENPTTSEMEEYFDGNLCRCTGYRAILDGFRTFTKEFKCAMGSQCCQNKGVTNGINGNGHNAREENITDIDRLQILGPRLSDLKQYNPSQEPIFPPALKVNHATYHKTTLKFSGPNVTWIKPSTLSELIQLKTTYPKAKLVVGNTEIGIETKFKNMRYPVLICTANIPELSSISVCEEGLIVGGSATLSQMDQEMKKLIKKLPEYQTRVLSAFVEMMKWFASHQIRNVASVSGNIMTASPISDFNPLFVAAGATVQVKSKERGERTVKMDKNFFCGYRKTGISDDEVLVSITIPFTKENEYFSGFKQANRKEDDISLVNAGMKVVLSESAFIEEITLAYGGMGSTVVMADKTMKGVLGKQWTDNLIPEVNKLLASDLPLAPGSPGGVVEYRRALALSFFFKFHFMVKQSLSKNESLKDLSVILPMENSPSKAMQIIGGVDSREKTNTVGKPFHHLSALQQSTGEAMYADDLLPIESELHLALVVSSQAYAKILSVDPAPALAAPGVVDFVSAADVPGENSLGIAMDTVFATDEVTCQGQVIGAVVADTQSHARSAAKLVNVEYEKKSPVIITIKDAIKHGSFYDTTRSISIGDLEEGFKLSDHILEGESKINGQNHFYLETNTIRVLPKEDGEIEAFCSTQDPTGIQKDIASVLDVPMNKVLIRTKRLGGGFGGKETQSVFTAAVSAVAARKLGRPIRCCLERDEDMVCTGNRHPFLGKYKVGFTSQGKVLALDMELYSNGGNSEDLSTCVMERAVLEIDITYCFKNMVVFGRTCRTNIMSNTAFRGFGAPQGHFIVESMMDEIANFLDMDSLKLREINFFHPNDLTHFEMPAGGEHLKRCWDMCIEKSDYHNRRKKVDAYNRENRWKKKGLNIQPLKFGISFIQSFMNQAGALVHIYRDGSVLVAHGGTEMGQGLHVKCAQIASEVLEIPLSYVYISETATNTVPNTIPSAASVSTDLNGMAVKKACETLKERLDHFGKKFPKTEWKELINEAYMDRISLSATGYFGPPDVGYDMENQRGRPFTYFTFGAGCSEVQIDCLTGDHKLLRTDIVMDIGESINPAIDVGQIEGAFTQGYGLTLLEDVKVTPDGFHLTQGPGTYKIPAFGNVPTEFNVTIVPDSPNPKAVFASRGVGEPPLLLAQSAFFAVKDAIRAARIDAGESKRFQLNSPALPANIRMACPDVFTRMFPEADPESYKPWAVDLC